MNKQTFTIPDGCKTVSIEQVGNQLITTFEPEFKKGDILTGEYRGLANIIVLDFISGSTVYLCRYSVEHNSLNSNRASMVSLFKLRFATESEKQLLFDALAKEGKQWNAETLQIEDLKVVPKVGDCVKIKGHGCFYYSIVSSFFSENNRHNVHFGSYLFKDDDECFICNGNGEWGLSDCEVLSKVQFQKELNELGFEYNFDNGTISELKWKPKHGEKYYYLNSEYTEYVTDFKPDNQRISIGNYFKTEKECEEAIEKIKNVLR